MYLHTTDCYKIWAFNTNPQDLHLVGGNGGNQVRPGICKQTIKKNDRFCAHLPRIYKQGTPKQQNSGEKNNGIDDEPVLVPRWIRREKTIREISESMSLVRSW